MAANVLSRATMLSLLSLVLSFGFGDAASCSSINIYILMYNKINTVSITLVEN